MGISPSHKQHLHHVNALRGVFILLVVLYHLNPDWCQNGFLGVDAFFVISGYFLLPPLLNNQYRGSAFTWWPYYKNKFLRIVPPLIVTIILTLPAATAVMIYPDLCALGAAAISSLTGISNIHFGWSAVNYFAPNVKVNPLLHTWYLSALLQVIAIAPLLCIPLSKLHPRWKYIILAAIGAVSMLIFFQHLLPYHIQDSIPSIVRDGGAMGSVYYMTVGRLWEILAGAFIVILPNATSKRTSTVISALGLLMIIIPSFWASSYAGFPLLAVVGTMITIKYANETSFSSLLQNKIIMWLGTVSFSLYLVHWPIFSISRYMQLDQLPIIGAIVCIVISLSITFAFYRWVEKKKWSIASAVLIWAVAVSMAYAMYSTAGFRSQLHPILPLNDQSHISYDHTIPAKQTDWIKQYPSILNQYITSDPTQTSGNDTNGYSKYDRVMAIGNGQDPPNFVLLGDSYASALYTGFDTIARKANWSGLYLNTYATPFWGRLNTEYLGIHGHFTKDKATALRDWLSQNPEVKFVFVNQHWNLRLQPAKTWDGETIEANEVLPFAETSLREFCSQMKSIGKEVILMLPSPELEIPYYAYLRFWKTRALMWYQPEGRLQQFTVSQNLYDEQMATIRRILLQLEQEGLCHLLDPVPILFKNGVFVPEEGNNLIVWDHGHLSVYGATKLISGLQKEIEKYVGKRH